MRYKKGDIVFVFDGDRSYALKREDYVKENIKRGVIISEYDVSLYTAWEPGRSYNVQSCQIMIDNGSMRSFYSNELDYFRTLHESNACNMKK